MTPRTMTETTAAEAMEPIPELLVLGATAARARRRMEELDLPFMIVVAPQTRRLLGVVLRAALERACVTNGHDTEECPIAQHLKADIDFCLAGEPLDEVLHERADEPEAASSLLQRRRRVRQSLPGTEGLVHISELQEGRTENTEDVVAKGDVTHVKLLSIDEKGKLRLSRKAALAEMGVPARSDSDPARDPSPSGAR